ncbi:hypothetical protein JHK84_040610 [Glycine max]|nr:hypothetical protein JHK84_040610 [Glycine max]
MVLSSGVDSAASPHFVTPSPDSRERVASPTSGDMSYLTILVPNEVQGLQVCRDGHCMIRSNGKYKAVFHRTTVNKYETRMSWPVFIKPKKEHEVGPHPKLVNQDNPSKYKTKIYKDYAYFNDSYDSPPPILPYSIECSTILKPLQYPEFVNFRYDGTIYQIRLRQHRAKVYFAEGLKEFRKDLSIYEFSLHFVEASQSPQTFIPSFVFVLAVTFTVKCLHVCTHGLYLNAMV